MSRRPQPHNPVIATVTTVEAISPSLFGVRVRMSNGTVGVIVIPKGLVSVESVILTTQAVMNIISLTDSTA